MSIAAQRASVSSAITFADKEGIIKPLLATALPLVLPVGEYSITPKPCPIIGEATL